uniref:Uncharacterized protein n=1 Tax=Setaria digitata TaxID=48799 RepID=A0A915PJN4_9BILA
MKSTSYGYCFLADCKKQAEKSKTFRTVLSGEAKVMRLHSEASENYNIWNILTEVRSVRMHLIAGKIGLEDMDKIRSEHSSVLALATLKEYK